MFNVGDKIQVTHPYDDVEDFMGCIGIIERIPCKEDGFYIVEVEGLVNTLEFLEEEMELFVK